MSGLEHVEKGQFDILDNLLEGCRIVDPQWRYLYVNDVAAMQDRVAKSGSLGHTMMEMHPGFEATTIFSMLKRSMETHVPEETEEEYQFPDGSSAWYQIKVEPMAQGIFILSSDITLRKQESARAEVLASVVDLSGDAIVGKTLEGIITSWNKAAEHMYGYTAQEAIGKSIAMIIPKDSDVLPKYLAMIARGESIEHYETKRTRKDGTSIDISLSLSPMRDLSGRIVGATAMAQDISTRQSAEVQLQLRNKELQKMNTLMIDREVRMVELKKEISDLKVQLHATSV